MEKPSGARNGEWAVVETDGESRNMAFSGGGCMGVVLKRGDGVLSKLLIYFCFFFFLSGLWGQLGLVPHRLELDWRDEPDKWPAQGGMAAVIAHVAGLKGVWDVIAAAWSG